MGKCMEISRRVLTSTPSAALVQPYVKMMRLDFCKNHNLDANWSIDKHNFTQFFLW